VEKESCIAENFFWVPKEVQAQQMISKSVITEEMVDVFEAVGFNRSNLSILSEEFLEEV